MIRKKQTGSLQSYHWCNKVFCYPVVRIPVVIQEICQAIYCLTIFLLMLIRYSRKPSVHYSNYWSKRKLLSKSLKLSLCSDHLICRKWKLAQLCLHSLAYIRWVLSAQQLLLRINVDWSDNHSLIRQTRWCYKITFKVTHFSVLE